MKKKYKKCMYCGGKGRFELTLNGMVFEKKRTQARTMYKAGIGLRTIARTLNIDHPQKIKAMILAKTK